MIQRAFLYGDLLIETIRVERGKICLEEKHYARLLRGATVLQLDIGNLSSQVFKQYILDALNGQPDARVRFIVYRDGEGFYTPQSNHTKWVAEVFPLQKEEKVCERLGVFTTYTKPCHALSNIKSGNALVYVMAGLYAKEQGLNDCLILNQYGRVAEATSSNVFMVKGNKIITPPLSEGCVAGVMRERIMEIALQEKIDLEELPIDPKELLTADEVFLTNAIQRVVTVKTYEGKSLSDRVTSILRSGI